MTWRGVREGCETSFITAAICIVVLFAIGYISHVLGSWSPIIGKGIERIALVVCAVGASCFLIAAVIGALSLIWRGVRYIAK